MVSLNRNNSNWSFEERRKINENWAILESMANSTASGNNGLKSEVDALKITVGRNTQVSNNALQKANQNSTIVNEANSKADKALTDSSVAITIASGVDAKANMALNTSNLANENSRVATENANESRRIADTVQSQFDSIIAESGSNNPEVVASRIDSETEQSYTSLPQRLDRQHKMVTDDLKVNSDNLFSSKKSLMSGFVAHRGLTSIAPENTIKAISEAGRRGFSIVEIDPIKLSDGNWVLMHDDTVDRTTNGTGNSRSFTLPTIRNLIIDSPAYQISEDETFRVPTLDEALKEIALYGMGVNLDGSKFDPIQSDINYLIEQTNKYGITGKSILVGSSYQMRQQTAAASDLITIAWTSQPQNLAGDIAEALTYKNNVAIGYNSNVLTEDIIYQLQSNGISVYAYRADDYATATRWINRGVEFVETDFLLPIGRFKK